MKLYMEKDHNEMSKKAASIILGYMTRGEKRTNIAPTAGKTPGEAYAILSSIISGTKINENNIHYYQQDEIISDQDHEAVIIYKELETMFFHPAAIPKENIHPLNANTFAVADESIEADGGLDLLIMGLGADGHIAANLPGTSFHSLPYKTPLSEESIGFLDQEFGPLLRKPTHLLSLSMYTIMKAKNLLLLVSGESKSEILKQAIEGPVSEEIQASILKMHPNLTIVCDEKAAALLTKKS